MYKFIKIALFFILLPKSLLAYNIQDCNKIASQLNKSSGMYVDQITILRGGACAPGEKIKLIYLYDIDNDRLKINDIKGLWKSQKNFWCTDPRQHKLLKAFNIEYNYYSKNGKYIATNNFTIRDCK